VEISQRSHREALIDDVTKLLSMAEDELAEAIRSGDIEDFSNIL